MFYKNYSRKKILNCLLKLRNFACQGILFVFIFLALYSCTSLRKIGIEVTIQPKYPIEDDIQSIVLLNRSMNGTFVNTYFDSLERILIKKKLLLDSVFHDSIAADTVIKVAAMALFESGRFDVVVPKDRNIVRTDSSVLANTLNANFINEICNDFKVDAILVLESFAEHLNTKYYQTKVYGNNYQEFLASTDITYKSEWRLYRSNNLKPVIRFQISDSIFWKEKNSSLKYLYMQMPKTKVALIGGGIAAGFKLAEYICPTWTSKNRYYFLTGKEAIDAAVPLIKNNKWEEAYAIWAKFTTTKSKLVRSKVEFNLALASEMIGEIDQAIEWGFKSYKTHYTKAIDDYLKILDKRRKLLEKETKARY